MSIEAKVIEEFGEQWTEFPENEGYYASLDLLADVFGPLISIEDLKDKAVAEIGSGSGRIVHMLANAGARQIVAIEPSAAMEPLKEYTKAFSERVVYLREIGEKWRHPNLDYVFSIGVIHHIYDPRPTIKNAYDNLKPGGKFLIWVYGYEGNELYLRFFGPIRKITPKLPHAVLLAIVWLLVLPLNLYVGLCKFLPLPMRSYMLNHIGRLNQKTRRITIYDQLNPSWARYYKREEAEALLREAGFSDVKSFHRHGYSWSLVGVKN